MTEDKMLDSKRKIAKKEYEVYRTVTEHHYFYVYADSQEEAERLAETDECYCDSLGGSLADTDVETESVRLTSDARSASLPPRVSNVIQVGDKVLVTIRHPSGDVIYNGSMQDVMIDRYRVDENGHTIWTEEEQREYEDEKFPFTDGDEE